MDQDTLLVGDVSPPVPRDFMVFWNEVYIWPMAKNCETKAG